MLLMMLMEQGVDQIELLWDLAFAFGPSLLAVSPSRLFVTTGWHPSFRPGGLFLSCSPSWLAGWFLFEFDKVKN